MSVGGSGQYNPNWKGFTTDGWMDIVESTSRGEKWKLIDALSHLFCETGAYNSDWSNVNLPTSPNVGRYYLRINTDASNAVRLYVWNGTQWKYIQFT